MRVPVTLIAGIWMSGVAPAGAQSVAAAIDSVLVPWNGTDRPGCAVGVERDGRRTRRAAGMANLEYGVALTPESVLESGSVAKQFTAAAVLLLAREGRLSLDDDIRAYLPEVPDFGSTITIRHLLQHTSGLRDQWVLLALQGHPPGQEVHTFARILDLVGRQRRLNFPPGEEYLYSNTGYSLTAVLVTRVAGQPFADFTRERLFQPLGMAHTQWRDDYRRIVPDRATAYDRQRGVWVQDMPFTMVHGNGGLLTTVGDLLTWNAALAAGTVPGGAALVRELETRGRLNDGSEIGYALGLRVDSYRGLRQVSHSGSTAGYRTFLARWPERSLSVAVMCNSADADPTGMARSLASRLLGLPAEEAAPADEVAIAEEELAPLTGVYRDSTTDQTITVRVSAGRLVLSGGGGGAPLTHLGGLRFWSARAGEYRFERAGSGWRVVQFADAWRRYDPVTVPDSATARLNEYVGSYRSPELEVTVEIRVADGRLVADRRPGDVMSLRPIYPDGFAGAGQTLRFDRDRRGRVRGFRVFAGRVRQLEFDRLP